MREGMQAIVKENIDVDMESLADVRVSFTEK